MASEKIQTSSDIKLKTIPQLYAEGAQFEHDFYSKYDYSLDKLLMDYPKDVFFIHPLKLSKWSTI